MDIEGLGERWISILLDQRPRQGPRRHLLTSRRSRLVALERMGSVLADKILKNIEASKGRNLNRLLFALGIRHVGGEVAQLLAAHFHNLDALMEASEEDIQNVEGIGPKIADSIHAYFQDEQKRAIIEKLRNAGVNFEYKRPKRIEGPLTGQSFVFTGTLASMPRGKAESLVASLGGEAGSSVTKQDHVPRGRRRPRLQAPEGAELRASPSSTKTASWHYSGTRPGCGLSPIAPDGRTRFLGDLRTPRMFRAMRRTSDSADRTSSRLPRTSAPA